MRTPARFWRTPGFAGLFALGALVALRALAAEPPNPRYTGALSIQEWTPEETGGKPQSFSILQDPATGLIYAGNEAGVLEYDGVRWRRLPLPAGAPAEGMVARGLELDDGRLWAAGDNEVLIYAPDAHGFWHPESLRANLPEAARNLGVVWELRRQGPFMWGVTTKGIIRIDRASLAVKTWPLAGNPAIMGLVDGDVWFRHDGSRLLRAHDGEIEPAPGPAPADGLWILGAVRTAAGILQLEHAGGVLELRDGAWVPLSAALAPALEGGASRVRRLPDGGRVFSTRSRTLIFADATGQLLGRIAEPPGVNFGVTPQSLVDRDGGLWLANASGIRRAQIDGNATRHGAAQGLRGGARKLAFDGPALLAATAQGLFVRDAATGNFAFQNGSPSDGQALLPSPVGGWLISAGQRFGEWRDGTMVTAPGEPVAGLALAPDPTDPARVFATGFNEVNVYRRSAAGWEKEAGLSGMAMTLYYAASDATGALWVTSGFQNGLWRITASGGDWSKATVERRSDLPEAPWLVASAEGEVVIFGTKGLWHEERPGGRLVADQRFAGLPRGAATPVLAVAPGVAAGTLYVAGALDLRDRFWRGTRARPGAPWQFTELSLAAGRGQIRLEDMRESPDRRTLWLGGTEAAFSVDLTVPEPEWRVPEARWRSVQTLEGEVLYGGAKTLNALDLPPGRRAVAVEYAAAALRTHLGGKTGLEYRTRIAGVDRDWTAWSAAASRELTNLPPGPARFEVQARNHPGIAGPVAVMMLQVPPFWWETWWVRTLAVLAGAGTVAAVVRWVVHRQFQQRIALLEAQAAVQQERLRIARDMHDDLGSTLAGIVHLSGKAAEPGGAPDAALTRIHAAARDLVQRTSDIVWAATPQHDSLESLVEQMAAHAERTLGDRGIGVRVELPPQVPDEAISAAARHDLFLAFKEAVNNAAKYSQARTATLRVELTTGALMVTLTDDGVGFAAGEVQGTGHGLPNLRSRLTALGGSAEIASTPGRGTTVVLRLPRVAQKA